MTTLPPAHALPVSLDQIEHWLDNHQVVEKQIIGKVVGLIQDLLESNGISGQVYGRIKHKHSIYKKMQAQSMSLDEMHDIMAFRVLVQDIKDCYATLGLVHSQWRPVHGRFKDYISMPKANGYQSLHTTLIGPFGTPVEVQIRTREMHHIAETGVASHWLYKEDERTLSESIAEERVRLARVAELGHHIDTSDLKPNALREWIRQFITANGDHKEPQTLTLSFESFGFKHGLVLSGQRIVRLGQDAVKFFLSESLQFRTERETALQLGEQVGRLG